MISGERLSNILSFNRGVVQAEILKTAAALLGIDRRLNMMRIEEALEWSTYAGGMPAGQGQVEAVEKVRAILQARHRRAEVAMAEAAEADVEAATLRKPCSESVIRLETAKTAFAEAERKAKAQVAADPKALKLRHSEQAILAHRNKLETWSTEAIAKAGPLLASFDTDPALIYLSDRSFGTDAYRAGPVARRLDRRLARRIGYEKAVESRARITAYQENFRAWLGECDRRLAEIRKRLEVVTEEAMAALDGPRSMLANALNEADSVMRRSEAIEIRRREAVEDVLQVALGKDSEYRAMVEAFVAMMAKERSAAMIRAAASPEGADASSSSALDVIVRNRIALSMEADGLRMHIVGAATRLRALEDVASRLALRDWNGRASSFDLDECTMIAHDLSMGRIGADAAWSEIEESLARDVPISEFAA